MNETFFFSSFSPNRRRSAFTFSITLIHGSSSTRAAGGRPFVGGTVHSQLPDVLIRVEDDDVNFWREETKQSDVRTQRRRDTKSSNLNLIQNERHVSRILIQYIEIDIYLNKIKHLIVHCMKKKMRCLSMHSVVFPNLGSSSMSPIQRYSVQKQCHRYQKDTSKIVSGYRQRQCSYHGYSICGSLRVYNFFAFLKECIIQKLENCLIVYFLLNLFAIFQKVGIST